MPTMWDEEVDLNARNGMIQRKITLQAADILSAVFLLATISIKGVSYFHQYALHKTNWRTAISGTYSFGAAAGGKYVVPQAISSKFIMYEESFTEASFMIIHSQ
ncbi:hypothetical protein [Pradoshia sp.]